jgi:hypothetical protein
MQEHAPHHARKQGLEGRVHENVHARFTLMEDEKEVALLSRLAACTGIASLHHMCVVLHVHSCISASQGRGRCRPWHEQPGSTPTKPQALRDARIEPDGSLSLHL